MMTTLELENYLHMLNDGYLRHVISIEKDTCCVDMHEVKINSISLSTEFTFYVYKPFTDGKYVSIILDMGIHNLHVFTLPEYRNNKHTKYFFAQAIEWISMDEDRYFQDLTVIANNEAMKKIVLNSGFTEIDGVHFTKKFVK